MPTIKIELTKTQVDILRRRIMLHTKTPPEVIVKSVINLIVDNKYALEHIQDENYKY